MTSRPVLNPALFTEKQQRPLQMARSKVYPMTPRTATKTQILHRSHAERTHQIYPSKKPKREVQSTEYSINRTDLGRESDTKESSEKQMEEWAYLEHLRRIQKHLQETTAILQQKKQLNKKVYINSLNKIDETKQNMWFRQLKMQKQMEELHFILKEYQKQH